MSYQICMHIGSIFLKACTTKIVISIYDIFARFGSFCVDHLIHQDLKKEGLTARAISLDNLEERY